jgi:predicted nucleic acid-binding protein
LTLYVESNFVLEIVLGQEESQPAERLLALAESGDIQIALPTFALSEPFSTVTGRRRDRGRLVGQINHQIGQLARSSPHHQDVAALQTIPGIVARVDAREADRLTQTVERVLGIARRIDTNLAVFREALDFQDRFDLEAQDAIILAAVVADLRTRAQAGPHYFANKNRQDFSVPGIHTESV